MLFRAAISSFALHLLSQWSPGAVCSCLRHLHPLYCISLKKYMRGEYDIGISVVVWHLFWYIFDEGGVGGRKLTKGGNLNPKVAICPLSKSKSKSGINILRCNKKVNHKVIFYLQLLNLISLYSLLFILCLKIIYLILFLIN